MRRLIRLFANSICCVCAACVLTAPSQAVERGKSQAGFAFVSGGVSHAELKQLDAERDRYSFWLTTAALGSGAFLAGVHVHIVDTKTRQLVLDRVMDGPWLLVALPEGRYEISGTFRAQGATKDEILTRATRIEDGELRQLVLYFDSPAEVSPENESPFKTSPYEKK